MVICIYYIIPSFPFCFIEIYIHCMYNIVIFIINNHSSNSLLHFVTFIYTYASVICYSVPRI